MKSFRTELEDPIVEQDILELEQKIHAFHNGDLHEEKFRSLRLARGVYGQRQQGVQMVRIKFPYGNINTKQLRRVAEVSDKYSNGNLHITTRQDIQIHYVSLDDTPELWTELELDDITIREACGNTVRNITASELAGVDPFEPYSIDSLAQSVFEYFLRNPVCQDMGRKIKIAISSNDLDSAYTFMHDIGLIPKIEGSKAGAKIVIGGGLGAQPFEAKTLYSFIPLNRIIPILESVLRVFDQHGERNRRNKARIKYLIQQIGIQEFKHLVEFEYNALTHQEILIPSLETIIPKVQSHPSNFIETEQYLLWKRDNVIAQKQAGYYAVGIPIQLGNISSHKARILANIIEQYAGTEFRLTIAQNILLRFIPKENLISLYHALDELDLAKNGYGSIADVTSCPGTDTCNLGISNSTLVATKIEELIRTEYSEIISQSDINIKLSGCMNSCGQHSLAAIGFHGSSMKVNGKIAPALQVLMGGGGLGDGKGQFSEKVIKVPSKRALEVIRVILNDYKLNSNSSFLDYYKEQGNRYFYTLLKPIADTSEFDLSEYLDWGADNTYTPEIGVGECAGVVIDLSKTLLFEAEEKLDLAKQVFISCKWSDAIYNAHNALIGAAKAILISKSIKSNSQHSVVTRFSSEFPQLFIPFQKDIQSFDDQIYSFKHQPATEQFAQAYINAATEILEEIEGQIKKTNHAS